MNFLYYDRKKVELKNIHSILLSVKKIKKLYTITHWFSVSARNNCSFQKLGKEINSFYIEIKKLNSKKEKELKNIKKIIKNEQRRICLNP